MDTDEKGKEVTCDTGVSSVLTISSTGETPVSRGKMIPSYPCSSVPHLWQILFLFSKGNR